MRRRLHVLGTKPLWAVGSVLLLLLSTIAGRATPALTMDLATGEVLYQQDATQPWFPASTTKLMTVFVALSAVRDHKIALDTPLVYSALARSMPPSKMGFTVGTQVTLETALRILMVRSANDVAVTVAEGVSGSVGAFADDMNKAAAELGLHESHFANPNGLPNPQHYSSARDMAIIARALYANFPEQASLFDIGELSLGSQIIMNHNNMLGRYPGVDGMKTGFTCAAGFNLVASAYRDGRRIITIIMGAPSVATRTAKAAALFDRAFANIDRPSGSIVSLPTTRGPPPDMRNQICRARGRLVQQFNSEVAQLDVPLMPAAGGFGLSALNPERGFLFNTQAVVSAAPMATRINSLPRPVFEPVPIHIGADPGYTGVVAEARTPHSPIGTGAPPVAAEAYAAVPENEPIQGLGVTPLRIDPHALPLKGRHLRVARHHGRKTALKAAAEAPKTKVIAGAEGDSATPAKASEEKGKSEEKAKSEEKGKKVRARKPALAAAKKPAAHSAKTASARTPGAKPASKKSDATTTE